VNPYRAVNSMAYSVRVRRFRGSRKRIKRIRMTKAEKWFTAILVVLLLLAMWAGWWLGFHYVD
jgi:hypothetical protein